jgi:hypothetical protein
MYVFICNAIPVNRAKDKCRTFAQQGIKPASTWVEMTMIAARRCGPRAAMLHIHSVWNRTHIAPIASCIATYVTHFELKSSSSISGTAERRVRRIEAVRVFGAVDQSNFYHPTV